MNAMGPTGCRAMLDDIVGWLTEEAKNRGWWKYAVAVPGASYFIRKMITDAIEESERLYNESRPPNFHAFYHVACMGNWREVFQEQADMFAEVGILPTACVLGSEADAAHVATRIHVHSRLDDLRQFETPTLQALYEWCQANPAGIALYAHTKGVSHPQDKRRVAWRQLMNEYVIRDWRQNVRKLDDHDACGVDWLDRPNPHFSGNFWMARADWINQLPSAIDHRTKWKPSPDDRWWDRLGCELWIGCRKPCRVDSLCCRNAWIWGGRSVHRLLAVKRNEHLIETGQAVRIEPMPQVQVVRHEAFTRHAARKNSAMVRFA